MSIVGSLSQHSYSLKRGRPARHMERLSIASYELYRIAHWYCSKFSSRSISSFSRHRRRWERVVHVRRLRIRPRAPVCGTLRPQLGELPQFGCVAATGGGITHHHHRHQLWGCAIGAASRRSIAHRVMADRRPSYRASSNQRLSCHLLPCVSRQAGGVIAASAHASSSLWPSPLIVVRRLSTPCSFNM